MHFTDIFIRRPILATVVSLLILLIGTAAMVSLPVRQYPSMESATIQVDVSFPGATQDVMQGFVTSVIAQSIATANGIEYMTSNSTLGTSQIKAKLVLNANADRAMTEVLAKVQQVKYRMPAGVFDPVITKITDGASAVQYIAFTSATLSSAEITDFATRVAQPLLTSVPGVASADTLGGAALAMRVWIDPFKLAARGLTAGDIAAALRANNVQSAPGRLRGEITVTNIAAQTDLRNLDDFRKMVIKTGAGSGGLVRLGDVATLEIGGENYDANARDNGTPTVFIGVQPTPDGNPLEIVAATNKVIGDLNRAAPPGLQVRDVFNIVHFVKASISEVQHALVEAIVIVVVVILLFLGSFRSVLIPVVTVPLSLVGTAAMMLALGFSINLLTLLAMVLAIGLVVDDAIVVVENIHRHIEEGLKPAEAALIGAREIIGPVVAMTITLAAVYAPIGLMGGLTGSMFREFAFTLAGSVIVSGVIALTLSPMMCSVFLKSAEEGRFAKLVNRVFGALTRAYGRQLDRSLDYRPITALFAVTILGLVGFLYMHIQKELAPQEDQGIVFAVTKAPKYANIDYIDFYGDKMDKEFQKFPETDLRFILNGITGPQGGFAGMLLKPWDERKRSAQTLQPLVQNELSKIEGVSAFAFSLPPLPGGPGGLPVQMVISSTAGFQQVFDQMNKLKEAARKSGLFIVTDSDLDFNQPVVRVKVDRSKASDLGITMQSIGGALATLLGGNYVNRFNLEGRSYQVIPQVPRANRLAPESFDNYYVPTATGQLVRLSTVVTVETGVDPNALTHYNQLNSSTFQAVPMPGVSMGQAVDFLQGEAKKLPSGFTFDFLADSRQYVHEGNQLLVTFAFAIIIIFLVLAAQFESLRDPFVIMISVPMAIVGALIPLFFGVATMNIYTQVGLLTLVGLITKHGILMVEFANELQLNEGLDRRSAIEMSARIRLRPILMTTAAMVTGLLPLLTASGAGAASRFSIGLVVVTGMTIGTLFTLFVLPMVYTVIATDHQAAARSERAKQIADYELEGRGGALKPT